METDKDTTIYVETKTKKSPTLALLYSFGGTLGPVLLGAETDSALPWAAGIFVGPSVGHLYAENTSQALTGIGLRLGGTALGVLGFLASFGGDSSGGSALFYTGGLTILTSGEYDIFTAGAAVRDYNETHGLKAHVGPAVGPQGEQAGLSLQVQF